MTNPTPFNITSAGANVIVPAVANMRVRVWGYLIYAGGTTTFRFEDSSDTPVVFTGDLPFKDQGGVVSVSPQSKWLFQTAVGKGFNGVLGTDSVAVSGYVHHEYFRQPD